MTNIEVMIDGRHVIVRGRAAWALVNLLAAYDSGCSYIEFPAPRWGAYVHELRRLGFVVETIREAHRGAFPGHHARYVLRSAIQIIQSSESGS